MALWFKTGVLPCGARAHGAGFGVDTVRPGTRCWFVPDPVFPIAPCNTVTSTTRPANTSSRARTRRARGPTTSARRNTARSSPTTPAATRSTRAARPAGSCGCASTASRSTSRAAISTCATGSRAISGRPRGSRSASRSTKYKSVCRHGTAYTILESRYAGIATEALYFVPLGQTFEYWRLRVANKTKRARQLSVFTYCEFANLWHTWHDLVNLQYSQFITGPRSRTASSASPATRTSTSTARTSPAATAPGWRSPARRWRASRRCASASSAATAATPPPRSSRRASAPTSWPRATTSCGGQQVDLDPGARRDARAHRAARPRHRRHARPEDRRRVRQPGRAAQEEFAEAEGRLARAAGVAPGRDARSGPRPHGQRLERLQRAHHLRLVALRLAHLQRRARRPGLPRHGAGHARRHPAPARGRAASASS